MRAAHSSDFNERTFPKLRWAFLVCGLCGACGEGKRNSGEPDLGPIEAVVDAPARAVWPGADSEDGIRLVPLHTGFYGGNPLAFWDAGPSTRATANVFWFCRRDATTCPFDASGVLDVASAVGDPVFQRIPGEVGFSPYWLVWTVAVPDDYQANSIKSTFGIETAEQAGQVEVSRYIYDFGGTVGPEAAVMNCMLVLANTELEGNGGPLSYAPSRSAVRVTRRTGWHKQYRVHYFDFTATEGIIPPDPVSQSAPQMPAADMYVFERDCINGSSSPLCVQEQVSRVFVSEPELGFDINQDGDTSDTNNILAGYPRNLPATVPEQSYTALWRLVAVRVDVQHDSDVALIDTPGLSEVTDVQHMFDLVEDGWLHTPVPVPAPGASGPSERLFSAPVQVPAP